MIKISRLTQQELTNKVAERWGNQYKPGSTFNMGRDPQEVLKKLVSLGPSPVPSDVNAIIGNDSWTTIRCDACDERVDDVVVIDVHEEHSTYLCKSCCEQAMSLFKE